MSKYDDYSDSMNYDIPPTMWALIAKGRGFENLEVAEVPVPAINPNQLLARVDAAGVCTSILKLIDQGPDHTFIRGWDMEKHPVILGDEGAITLVKVGDHLKDRYLPGQRFAIQPAVDTDPINHRDRYQDVENMHKCAVGYTLGGHLSQYIVVQEEVLKADCMLPLPDENMSYFAASMAEPISCIVSAQDRNYHIHKDGPHARRVPKLGLLSGGVAVVIGAGAMGRIHAELALRYRPAVLIVSDLQQERLDEVVKSIGQKAKDKGTELVCVLPDILEKVVKAESHGRGADDIILAIVNQDIDPGNYVAAVGSLDNAIDVLKMIKETKIDGKAILYPHIKQTPLQRIEHWDKEQEAAFLNQHL